MIEEASKENIEINGRKPEVFSLLDSPCSQVIEDRIKESRENDQINDVALHEDRNPTDNSEEVKEATFDARYYMMRGEPLPFDNTEMSC